MQHAQKSLVFMILLVTPLLLSGIIIPVTQEKAKTVVTQNPVKVNVPSYVSINPIAAYNDFDLDNYASALSWDGDGSLETPYIIEGYSIINNSDCIWIQDVTKAFQIRNCYIVSSSGVVNDGIFIENVAHAEIYDTVVVNKTNSITVWDTPAPYIGNCTITGSTNSMYLYNCTGATISECQIFDVSTHGINIEECDNTMISNSEINDSQSGAGIKIYLSDHVTLLGNDISECSSSGVWAVDSLHLYAEDNTIHENWFFTGPMCGIHLDGSSYARIIDNDIYENALNGIFLDNSDWVNITDNDIYSNSDHGIDAVNSIIVNVERNNIFSNGWWPIITNSLCGIYLGSGVRDWYISENMIWNNTPTGISVEFADEIQISNNEIFNNTDRAIYASSYGVNEDLKIFDNLIYGNGYLSPSGGIILYGYENCTIERNQIFNNTGNGILSHGSYNNITDNEVYDTIGNGINIEMTGYNLVLENRVYDNTEAGIFLYAYYTDAIYNLIYDNGIGIHLYSSSSCNMYGNDIGWNTANALEEYGLLNNVWYATFDDFGNHWNDHVPPTGEGINRYPISNGTDYVAYDTKPDVSLNMTVATPTSYEILETGNVLVWEAYALNPGSYAVWIDSVYQYSEAWDGGDIILDVDGLPHGFHDILVSVFHISGHGLGWESNVTVEDLTDPSAIEGPDGISTGLGIPLSVQYSSEDPSGVTWTVNNTVSFAISSTGVLTNATTLPLGRYVILITATDPYGHSTTKIVTVTIVPDPDGLPPTLLLAVAGGGAIVLLIIGGIAYKRKKG